MDLLSLYPNFPEGAAAEVERFARLNHAQPPSVAEGPLVGNLAKLRASFESARKELRRANLSLSERTQLNTSLQEAARADVVELLTAEKTRLTERLDSEATAWNRDRELHPDRTAAELAKARSRFAAMSVDELTKAAEALNLAEPVAPEILDALSAELRAAAPADHALFRKALAERRAYEPWRHTPNGTAAATALEAVEQALTRGGAEVPIALADGSIRVESLSALLPEV